MQPFFDNYLRYLRSGGRQNAPIMNSVKKQIVMKINFIALAAAALAMVSCGNAKGDKAAAEAAADSLQTEIVKAEKPVSAKGLLPTKAEKDSVSYLMGINFGSFLKAYNFGDDLNYGLIKKGINDFLKAKGTPRDSAFASQFKINPEEMNELFDNYLQKRRQYTLAVNKEKEQKFLAANAKKEGVQVTESGLQYIINETGTENKAEDPRDTVVVRYKGTLEDGTVFDETHDTPATFSLNRVIRGWTEGMQLVGEGGSIRLFVPSELAYGENGTQNIEPNTPLIFDVTIEQVKKFVEKEEEAPAKKK